MEKRSLFADFDEDNPTDIARDQAYIKRLLAKDQKLQEEWLNLNSELDKNKKNKK